MKDDSNNVPDSAINLLAPTKERAWFIWACARAREIAYESCRAAPQMTTTVETEWCMISWIAGLKLVGFEAY